MRIDQIDKEIKKQRAKYIFLKSMSIENKEVYKAKINSLIRQKEAIINDKARNKQYFKDRQAYDSIRMPRVDESMLQAKLNEKLIRNTAIIQSFM